MTEGASDRRPPMTGVAADPRPPMIRVRPIEPADRAAMAFVLGQLGPDSRYQRFLGVRGEFTAADLDRLTGVDHWHHEALMAFATAPRRPVGTARYVRTERFDTAELAVEVADGWQRHGIGSELTGALRQRAINAGIRHFIATMLPGNRGADALARALGRRVVLGQAHGILEIAITLYKPWTSL